MRNGDRICKKYSYVNENAIRLEKVEKCLRNYSLSLIITFFKSSNLQKYMSQWVYL